MKKIEEIMKKEAVEFLHSKESNITLTTDYYTYVKGQPVNLFEKIGIKEIIPIYSYENSSLFRGIPQNLELAGIYITQSDTYILINLNSKYMFYSFQDYLECDYSNILDGASRKLKEKVWEKINADYESISPAEEYDANAVNQKYYNGIEISTEMDTELINSINKHKMHIEITDEVFMKEAANADVAYDTLADEHIRQNEIYTMVAKQKRENMELKKLYASSEYSHVIEVKKVLNKAASEGKKSVTATFDFGWAYVENIKISTHIDKYGWMETLVAKDEFTYANVQPVTMGCYQETDYEKYMPYITKLKYGKNVLFEHEVKVEHELENHFHNLLYRYISGETAFKTQVYELLNNPQLDLSVQVQNDSMIEMLTNRFYTDLDIVKAIIKKGAGIYDEEIKEIYEKYQSNMYRTARVSRNFEEIMKYYKTYLAKNNKCWKRN